jgi:hypothetical protein
MFRVRPWRGSGREQTTAATDLCRMAGRWTDERRELRKTVGKRSRDIPYLLGGWGSRKDVRTGQLSDGPKEKWKPDMEVVKATIRFLEKTGRLTYQPEAE